MIRSQAAVDDLLRGQVEPRSSENEVALGIDQHVAAEIIEGLMTPALSCRKSGTFCGPARLGIRRAALTLPFFPSRRFRARSASESSPNLQEQHPEGG